MKWRGERRMGLCRDTRRPGDRVLHKPRVTGISGLVSAKRKVAACLAAACPLGILPAPFAYAQEGELPTSEGLSYLTGFGPKAYPVVTQLYGTIIISLLVTAIVAGLVLFGAVSRRRAPEDGRLSSVPLESAGRGLPMVYIGTGLSAIALFATAVWGYFVLADIAEPNEDPVVTIRVTGNQWWWRVEYLSPDPQRQFVTANQIHIPVGRPVHVELRSADVIHAFWVPALGGKMDMIPTQENETWLQADKAGVFRGQCTEYCGRQHAHMAFLVTAQPPKQFQDWWDSQLEGSADPPRAFMQHCAVCHAIRGTLAQGRVGPDLSHLMQRKTLAAGTLPNTLGYLSGWISNPQHIKPGNGMPTLELTTRELEAIRSYLLTLR